MPPTTRRIRKRTRAPHKDRHSCSSCNATFETYILLRNHRRIHRAEAAENIAEETGATTSDDEGDSSSDQSIAFTENDNATDASMYIISGTTYFKAI